MAEAAGFALAVFPLLISAAEHYAEVTVAFRRYNRFADEAGKLAKILNIQRVIFRTTNKSLLERIVGREQAGDMLDNAHHASWEDKLTEDTFVKQLGDLAEPIVDSIQLIEGELEALGRESQKLAALTVEKEEVNPPLSKSLPIHINRVSSPYGL
jgi:tRNA G26 N,N-dimethylase Trm1